MKLKSLLIFILIFSLNACCLFKKQQTTDKVAETKIGTEETITVATYRFVIAFISRGEGINHEAHEHFQNSIRKLEVRYNKEQFKREVVRYGREGEVKYCFKLEELNKDQQKELVKELKQSMQAFDLCFIYENIPCDNTSNK